VVIVAPLAATAPVPRDAQKPRIDYFPTQVGSKWVYKNTENPDWERTNVITSADEKNGAMIIRVGTQAEDGTVEHRETWKLSPSGLFQCHESREDEEAPTRYLKFPIQVGDKWDCRCTGGTMGVATCMGCEEVEVPAGRFKAVKVVARWKTQNIGGGEARVWFVLGIGLVKCDWGDGGAATVLHSFTAGETKALRVTPPSVPTK
jgi:hypothetical protein